MPFGPTRLLGGESRGPDGLLFRSDAEAFFLGFDVGIDSATTLAGNIAVICLGDTLKASIGVQRQTQRLVLFVAILRPIGVLSFFSHAANYWCREHKFKPPKEKW